MEKLPVKGNKQNVRVRIDFPLFHNRAIKCNKMLHIFAFRYTAHFISLYIIFLSCFAPPPFIGVKRKGE